MAGFGQSCFDDGNRGVHAYICSGFYKYVVFLSYSCGNDTQTTFFFCDGSYRTGYQTSSAVVAQVVQQIDFTLFFQTNNGIVFTPIPTFSAVNTQLRINDGQIL